MSTKNYTFRKLFLKNEREIKIFPAKKKYLENVLAADLPFKNY